MMDMMHASSFWDSTLPDRLRHDSVSLSSSSIGVSPAAPTTAAPAEPAAWPMLRPDCSAIAVSIVSIMSSRSVSSLRDRA